jgi:glycosyltransferase involved in cell wall biosynthesis
MLEMRPSREKGQEKMPDLRDENDSKVEPDNKEIGERLPLMWCVPPHDYGGNALGYNSHNSSMMRYSEKYFYYTPKAPVALHIVPANFFKPIPGKFNILFTMWEGLDLPPVYKKMLPLADLVVVPCKFCQKIFQPYTPKPVEICWEGTEPMNFPYHERRFPDYKKGEKFRYLWVGAPNPRKGYPQVLEIVKIAQKHPNIEVYMKTTTQKLTWKTALRANIKNFRDIYKIQGFPTPKKLWHVWKRIPKPGIDNKLTILGQHNNIFFDTRKLPIEELRSLYNSAHCFILPSWGEGWGLTLTEAMATGAPCVSVSNTGTADFFDEQVGYVVRDEITETEFRNYDFKGRIYFPMADDFLRRTVEVYQNYAEALKRGRKASRRIHEKFTWSQSAYRLYEIIRKAVPNVSEPERTQKIS